MAKHCALIMASAVFVLLACMANAEEASSAKQNYAGKGKSSSFDPSTISSTFQKVMSGLKHVSSKFGTARAGGGGYGGGGYEDDSGSDDSGLSTIVSMLALLLAGLALLASLLGPLVGLLGTGNNLLTPTIQGGTLSVLPTNPNLAGRRRRDAGDMPEPQTMASVLALLDDAITRFDRLNTGCQNELACDVQKDDMEGVGQITKNFVYIYRALKSSDVSLIQSNPQQYMRDLVEKMTSAPECSKDKSKSQC